MIQLTVCREKLKEKICITLNMWSLPLPPMTTSWNWEVHQSRPGKSLVLTIESDRRGQCENSFLHKAQELSWVTLLIHLGPWREAWLLLFVSPYFLSLKPPPNKVSNGRALLAHHLEIAFHTFSEADSFSAWLQEIVIQVQRHTCTNFIARPFTKRGKRKFSCTEHNLNNPQYLLARLP